MGLRLTVLGAAGSYAGPGQACSGYLVQGNGTTVWLDAGPGTLANLQRHVALDEVDAIVLSHRHPDHCRDVEGFYVATRWYHPRDRVPVFAARGVEESLAYRGRPLDYTTVTDGDVASVGSLRLTFSRTDHSVECMAVRVDGEGSSLGYSADSGPGWSLEALGAGLDLALCEATFLQDDEGKAPHMSARQAGLSARAAGVGRLVVTHLAPPVDREAARREAAEAFGRPVDVATEHEVYEL